MEHDDFGLGADKGGNTSQRTDDGTMAHSGHFVAEKMRMLQSAMGKDRMTMEEFRSRHGIGSQRDEEREARAFREQLDRERAERLKVLEAAKAAERGEAVPFVSSPLAPDSAVEATAASGLARSGGEQTSAGSHGVDDSGHRHRHRESRNRRHGRRVERDSGKSSRDGLSDSDRSVERERGRSRSKYHGRREREARSDSEDDTSRSRRSHGHRHRHRSERGYGERRSHRSRSPDVVSTAELNHSSHGRRAAHLASRHAEDGSGLSLTRDEDRD